MKLNLLLFFFVSPQKFLFSDNLYLVISQLFLKMLPIKYISRRTQIPLIFTKHVFLDKQHSFIPFLHMDKIKKRKQKKPLSLKSGFHSSFKKLQ